MRRQRVHRIGVLSILSVLGAIGFASLGLGFDGFSGKLPMYAGGTSEVPGSLEELCKNCVMGPMESSTQFRLTAHPWLTRQGLALFDRKYPARAAQLSSSVRAYLILGSIEEDWDMEGTSLESLFSEILRTRNLTQSDIWSALDSVDPTNINNNRCQNHFYALDENGQAIGLTYGTAVGQIVTSLAWAQSDDRNTCNWSGALLAGHTEDGWRRLGHVLHLLQDLGSPAHVRNDYHGFCSNESWREYSAGLKRGFQPDKTIHADPIEPKLSNNSALFASHLSAKELAELAANQDIVVPVPQTLDDLESLWKSVVSYTSTRYFSETTILADRSPPLSYGGGTSAWAKVSFEPELGIEYLSDVQLSTMVNPSVPITPVRSDGSSDFYLVATDRPHGNRRYPVARFTTLGWQWLRAYCTSTYGVALDDTAGLIASVRNLTDSTIRTAIAYTGQLAQDETGRLDWRHCTLADPYVVLCLWDDVKKRLILHECELIKLFYDRLAHDGNAPVVGEVPGQPTILQPSANTTGSGPNPTIRTSAFISPDRDSQASATWEIYDSSSLAAGTLVWSSTGDTVNLTRTVVNASNGQFSNALSGQTKLATGTSYWVRVRYTTSVGVGSSFSDPVKFTTAHPADTPSVSSPVEGQTGLSCNPEIQSSPFSNPEGNSHVSSTWEVYDRSSPSSDGLVWLRVADPVNLTSITVNTTNGTFSNSLASQTKLSNGTLYWVRVLYTDSLGIGSNFSSPVKFTTVAHAPVTPTVVSPAEGETAVPSNPVIRASEFSSPDGNTQASTTWEIYDDASLATAHLVWWRVADTENLTCTTANAANGMFSSELPSQTALSNGTPYWVRVRYTDNRGNASDFSTPVMFTTGISWARGGPRMMPNSLEQTADGGFVWGGMLFCDTQSFGYLYYRQVPWIAKLNPLAKTGPWSKIVSASTETNRFIQQIRQATDGGYIVAGTTGTKYGGLWVLKLDSTGTTITWQMNYGATGKTLTPAAIQEADDGGFVVAGTTSSYGAGSNDFWVMKLPSDGATITWLNTYGGAADDTISSMAATPSDHGVVVSGTTSSYGSGNQDVWVLKLNADGTVAWQKTYGGAADDLASVIRVAPDGGYVVAGGTRSFGAGDQDAWVLKLNADGTVAWQKAYGSLQTDKASWISQPMSDGGFAVVGETSSFGAGGKDIWVFKLSGTGETSWRKAYGGPSDEWNPRIERTVEGGYVIAFTTDSEAFGVTNTAPFTSAHYYGSLLMQLFSDGTCPPMGVDTGGTSTLTSVVDVSTNCTLTSPTISISNTSASFGGSYGVIPLTP